MIEFNTLLESIKIPQVETIRIKRQTSVVNCLVLNIELKSIIYQIAIIQQNIASANAALGDLDQKIDTFKIKISKSTGSILIASQNILKYYQNLADTTTMKINILKEQMATLLARKEKINFTCNQIPTTLPPSPEPFTWPSLTPSPDLLCARKFAVSFACGK